MQPLNSFWTKLTLAQLIQLAHDLKLGASFMVLYSKSVLVFNAFFIILCQLH